MNSLILIVTRSCNLRCSYCPTVKQGWPSLTTEDISTALHLFVEKFGGGEIKLFGGEPLLAPEQVRHTIRQAESMASISKIYLSTNGLGLDLDWLAFLQRQSKVILTISMDGRPSDHRKMRRALPGIADVYDHLMAIKQQLLAFPKLVITQTIAPSLAYHAAQNFSHLCELGFRKFNFLPGYFIPWRPEQLQALRTNFAQIRKWIEQYWRVGKYLYVRNLFIQAPTPFFNTGLIVDADRSIHPSNLGLSGSLDGLRVKTQIGDLDNPPTPEALSDAAQRVNKLLQEELSEKIWNSTMAADAELTRFCRQLWPSFLRYRKSREVMVS